VAAAVCLIFPLPGNVTGVAFDPFGVEVMRAMAPGLPEEDPLEGTLESVFSSGSGPVLCATSQGGWGWPMLADSLAFRESRPWLPIILESGVVRVGPYIRPPGAPCFRCRRRRQLQHAEDTPQAVIGAETQPVFRKPPYTGAYLPFHVRLAAAAAGAQLRSDARETDPSSGATVTSISLFPVTVSQQTLLPWAGCETCGRPAPLRPSEALADVAARLSGDRVREEAAR
jgi:bacteriocin biosynthesis cyclodehydratase domain-containing protein